jgi:hypothetical protein
VGVVVAMSVCTEVVVVVDVDVDTEVGVVVTVSVCAVVVVSGVGDETDISVEGGVSEVLVVVVVIRSLEVVALPVGVAVLVRLDRVSLLLLSVPD